VTKQSAQERKVGESRELLNSYLANTALMLSTPVRLVILSTLVQSPRTVEELADLTDQSMANVSQHLAKLKNARLVESEKKGVQRLYALASPTVQKVVVALQELAREISAEVVKAEDTLVAPELRATEPLADILADVVQQRAALIDVRTSKEQSATPVNLALQIPVESETDLEKVLQATPKDKPVYVFCRGAYCITASRTAEFLRSQGRQAWCLRETALEIERPHENETVIKPKKNRTSITESDE